MMDLAIHPTIQNLAGTDPELLKFFAPVERAVIEACKEIVESRQAINTHVDGRR